MTLIDINKLKQTKRKQLIMFIFFCFIFFLINSLFSVRGTTKQKQKRTACELFVIYFGHKRKKKQKKKRSTYIYFLDSNITNAFFVVVILVSLICIKRFIRERRRRLNSCGARCTIKFTKFILQSVRSFYVVCNMLCMQQTRQIF